METRLLPLDGASLALAGDLIRQGSLVGFPTETVYGLGADALNEKAVLSIFAAKGRPADNPLIVHISAIDQLYPLIKGEPSETAARLIKAFWPGPLTMIFPKSDIVPYAVTAGLDTVAIRFPVHPGAQALIDAAGCPVAAPSANRSGRPSPTTAAHVFEDMNGRIPLILDGGACNVGVESTVLDVTGDIPRILRPGGITREMVFDAVGSVEVDPAVMRPLKEGETVRSPGMKYRHYAPNGQLTIVKGTDRNVAAVINQAYDMALASGAKPLILALESHKHLYGDRRVQSLGMDADDMARGIFADLRLADSLGADTIFSEAVTTDGVGLAVMNRLGRAAAFNVIDADRDD